MRPFGVEVRDDRALAIVPAARLDAGLAAHRRLGAVGADHEPGAELAPIAETDADRIAGRLERREIRAQQYDAHRLGARRERGLDAPVLADVAKVRLAEFGGIEDERVGPGRVLALFPDHHALVGRGTRGDRGPGAGALEELLRRARERRYADVERARPPRARRPAAAR